MMLGWHGVGCTRWSKAMNQAAANVQTLTGSWPCGAGPSPSLVVVHCTALVLSSTMLVQVLLPMVMLIAEALLPKFAPSRVTLVPAAVEPRLGLRSVMLGVRLPAKVKVVASNVDTAAPGGGMKGGENTRSSQ
jgi:hypothetical protein